MKATQKDIFLSAIQQFSDPVMKQGFISSFNSGTYTADVQLIESGFTPIRGIPVSRNIPSRMLTLGAKCIVLLLDTNNPLDSVVTAIYSGASGAPNIASSFNNGQVASNSSTTNYVTLPSTRLTLTTGPGRILMNLNTAFFMSGSTSTATGKVRIQMTVNELQNGAVLAPLVSYFPSTTGWTTFWPTQNTYSPVSFELPAVVPQGNHNFEVQFRLDTAGSGAVMNIDSNGATQFNVREV